MKLHQLLAVIGPTADELDGVAVAFGGTPPPTTPLLVMVQRAYRAGFYTDELPDSELDSSRKS